MSLSRANAIENRTTKTMSVALLFAPRPPHSQFPAQERLGQRRDGCRGFRSLTMAPAGNPVSLCPFCSSLW